MDLPNYSEKHFPLLQKLYLEQHQRLELSRDMNKIQHWIFTTIKPRDPKLKNMLIKLRRCLTLLKKLVDPLVRDPGDPCSVIDRCLNCEEIKEIQTTMTLELGPGKIATGSICKDCFNSNRSWPISESN